MWRLGETGIGIGTQLTEDRLLLILIGGARELGKFCGNLYTLLNGKYNTSCCFLPLRHNFRKSPWGYQKIDLHFKGQAEDMNDAIRIQWAVVAHCVEAIGTVNSFEVSNR